MLRIAAKTKLLPEEIINQAAKFFGPGGFKLKIANLTNTSASFTGGGGSVVITALKENGKTSVDCVSCNWDYQVKEFVKLIRSVA